jgi:hypothetical protein
MFSWDAAVAVAWSEIGRIVPNHLTRKSFSRYVGYLTDTAYLLAIMNISDCRGGAYRRASIFHPCGHLAHRSGRTRLWHWNRLLEVPSQAALIRLLSRMLARANGMARMVLRALPCAPRIGET